MTARERERERECDKKRVRMSSIFYSPTLRMIPSEDACNLAVMCWLLTFVAPLASNMDHFDDYRPDALVILLIRRAYVTLAEI